MNIGKIIIDKPLILAPMDGLTDMPFRTICRRLGADIVYSEFLRAENIIQKKESRIIKQKIQFSESDRPTVIQIYSENIDNIVNSIKIISQLKPDIIDLNFGCWKSDIVKRGACAGMLKTPDLLVEIVRRATEVTDIPITVKTRLGWDENSIIIDELAQRIEEAGAKALAVHCRTRNQGYSGQADWSWIPKIKRNISIPLFLNGDVQSTDDIQKAFDDYGADGVMIGRAAVADPFIFSEAKNIYPNDSDDLSARFEICIEHLKLNEQFFGAMGILRFRKYYSTYLKKHYDFKEIYSEIINLVKLDEILSILEKYFKKI